jgi:hypothetical protein
VEDSESAKQKTQVWQPGSAQAQFGVKANHKNFRFKKFLWLASQPSFQMEMPALNRNISLS